MVQRIQIAQADVQTSNGRVYPKRALLNAFLDFVTNKKEGPIFEEVESPDNYELDREDRNLLGYFDNLEFDKESGKMFCTVHLFKRLPKPYLTLSGLGCIYGNGRVDDDYTLIALMNSNTTSWRFQEEERIKKIVRERDNAERAFTELKTEATKVQKCLVKEEMKEKLEKARKKGLKSSLVLKKDIIEENAEDEDETPVDVYAEPAEVEISEN